MIRMKSQMMLLLEESFFSVGDDNDVVGVVLVFFVVDCDGFEFGERVLEDWT